MEDWDLNAIVKGCCLVSSSPATSSPTTTTTSNNTVVDCTSISLDFRPIKDDLILPSPTHRDDDLREIYRPFFFSNPASISRKNISFVSSPVEFPRAVADSGGMMPHKWVQEKQFLHSSISRCSPWYHHLHSRTQRLKRRKNQTRRVCHMPAEELSCDEWAWRKYGQKPIKGSPYPRGYYRCSSSKGCTARKQVERNKSDPGMFILTYTGEHNHPAPTHRNSLAGSTRQKPVMQTPATVAGEDDQQEMTTEEEKELELEEGEEEKEEMGLYDLMVRDDIFHGLEDILAGEVVVSGEVVPPAPSSLPWLPKKAATAAGGSC